MPNANTAPVEYSNWRETTLWKTLLKKRTSEARAVKLTVENWMPRIEAVLTSGGTAPLDFTLHDSGHARRVAERMADIIPKQTLAALSSYEIAMLLFSAYLHDIGMTPEQRKVATHLEFLLTGNKDVLQASEIN